MTILGLILATVGALGVVWVQTTPRLVRSGGKPLAEPRHLYYLDAWQTVIFEAGDDTSRIRADLLSLLSQTSQNRFACCTEMIWHWGLDGKTEREQIVLRHGRSMVFCQVHHYGSDLYVGWDAHLNIGTWLEKTVGSGIDRQTGERVRVVNVTHGTQPTGEYDLVDLNCLLEWTHAQVTKVLRQYLKEKEIDQEVDFQIIRGDRQQATHPQRQPSARRLFRRTA